MRGENVPEGRFLAPHVCFSPVAAGCRAVFYLPSMALASGVTPLRLSTILSAPIWFGSWAMMIRIRSVVAATLVTA